MPNRTQRLYVGQKVDDLKRQSEVSKEILRKPPDKLLISADKLYSIAEDYFRKGDEEMSYIHFMKYLCIISSVINQHKSTIKNNPVIGKSTKALDYVTELHESLTKRYAIEESKAKPAAPIENYKGDIKNKTKDLQEVNPQTLSNGYPDECIGSAQLKNMLNGETKLFIFDARPSASFKSSHISNSEYIINIPEEIICKGLIPSSLQEALPAESKKLWNMRDKADLIVLVDWCSKLSSLNPSNKLFILKSIMIEWDINSKCKRTPVILEGGYDDWLLKYPMCTTNPKATHPPNFNNNTDISLDNIDYPNLSVTSPTNDVPQPKINRLLKPVKPVPTPPEQPENTQSKPSNNVPRTPEVDRNAKANAIKTYEERSREVMKLLEERADKSLQLEKEMLDAEENIEELRRKREKEAEEENKAASRHEEERLIKRIETLSKELQETVIENQNLRNMLEKQQDVPEIEKQNFNEELNARLKVKEVEKQEIAELRKLKEQQRYARNIKKQNQDIKKIDVNEISEKGPERRPAKMDKMVIGNKDEGVYYTELKNDATTSSMKRSHSSPNIAQIGLNDITPYYDRSNKPQTSRPSENCIHRNKNLFPVFGKVAQGLTGLKNLGNTCYMNCILQCLSNTTFLTKYFSEGTYKNAINKQSETHGNIAEEVAYVIRELWSGKFRYFSCNDLRATIGRYRAQFQTSQQQDSNEFLTVLMDWLHEDLKKKEDIMAGEIKENMSTEASKHFTSFYKKNQSVIVDLFYGLQRSTVRCSRCSEESTTYETFSNLTLPLPSNKEKCTLDDCIRMYLEDEVISGWTCPLCKEHRKAQKKLDIVKLPQILIIHFKRFYVDGWCRKRQTFVDFPLSDLDMVPYTLGSDNAYSSFNLYAVSNHYGTMEGGHYTAFCKNVTKNMWYKFDDHEVSEVSTVRTGAAYILFYAANRS